MSRQRTKESLQAYSTTQTTHFKIRQLSISDPRDVNIPGPGTYNIESKFVSKAKRFPAYSMGLKHKKSIMYEGKCLEDPAPGQYHNVGGLKFDGKQAVGKYENARAYSFGIKTD